VRFEFTGSASEYFRIWIVNVALTVVTLGIYAAWAKVAKRRWFWGHTSLRGRAFDYTADPIAILKGNLIFAAGGVGYFLAARVEPLLALLPAIAVWLVYPWLFQKSMRFNAYNTRHRNIRFDFRGSVGESYTVLLGLALLVPFTLGLIAPYVQYRKKRYQLGNLGYGTAPFRFDGEVGPFYASFFASLAFLVAGLIAGVLVMGVFGRSEEHAALAGVLGFACFYLGGAAAGLYFATRVTNDVFGRTALAHVATFRSSMRVGEVFGIEIVNLLAIVATLGLAIPWAAVRRTRYRWTHLELRSTGDIEAVAADLTPEPGALGDVAADQFDVDIAL
jgi:uncharacterized membrane protein YjgN (DUF898 family)